MREIVFEPKECLKSDENPEPKLSGSVTVQGPSFEKKYQILMDEDIRGLKQDESDESKILNLKAMLKVLVLCKDQIKKVDLKHVDGSAYDSIDGLKNDGRLDGTVFEIAAKIMETFAPEKNS